MGSIFRFKQFEVDQRDCAMKINTDGVLLGAVVRAHHPLKILDIGSGTGVIALMLAQRFEHADVDAVEIDKAAYLRSKENFLKSRFGTRLQALEGSFEDLNSNYSYDLIVSNPPFYTNSLHNPDQKKKLARHADFHFFNALLEFSASKLSVHGSLQLILPTELALYIIEEAIEFGFFLHRKIEISSFDDSEIIRLIVELRKMDNMMLDEDKIVLYKEKGIYTERYRELLSPFFLAF